MYLRIKLTNLQITDIIPLSNYNYLSLEYIYEDENFIVYNFTEDIDTIIQ